MTQKRLRHDIGQITKIYPSFRVLVVLIKIQDEPNLLSESGGYIIRFLLVKYWTKATS